MKTAPENGKKATKACAWMILSRGARKQVSTAFTDQAPCKRFAVDNSLMVKENISTNLLARDLLNYLRYRATLQVSGVAMKKRVIFGLMSAAAIALFVHAGGASATTISVDQVFTGATPDGSPPWLVATFTQTGSNTGTLTLTSHLNGTDFLQGLESPSSAVGWAFFLDQSVSALTCISGTCGNSNSGFDAGGFNTGPVGDIFNLGFGWDVSNRFGAGDSAIYDLTFDSALSGDPFVANGDGWSSVAHVQGIGPSGDSGWIVAGGPVVVPEPAELGLFGVGALVIGLFAGLRRRWS